MRWIFALVFAASCFGGDSDDVEFPIDASARSRSPVRDQMLMPRIA